MGKAATKKGWTKVKFGEVVRLAKDRSKDPLTDGIERYVGLEHIDPEDLRIRRWGQVADGTTFTSKFRPGQVLFGKRRAYQRKVAVADFEGVCSGDIYVFEPKDKNLLPELLPFLCQTDAFFDYAISTSAGSLSPRTNWKSLADFEFALPPLEEQRRMVACINSIEMQLEALFKATWAAKRLENSVRDEFFTKCTDPTMKVQDFAEVVTKGESPRWQGFKYSDSGVPFITSENVLENEVSLESLKYIPDKFHKKLARSQIKPGDVLINIVGASIGRAAVVPASVEYANTNQAVSVVRLDSKKMLAHYFVNWYLHPRTQQFILSRQVNTARANISLTDIRNFSLPTPSIEHQEEFMQKMTQIQNARKSIDSRWLASKAMKHSIIDRWFRS